MINFIKIMRTFGRVEDLEKLLLPTTKDMIQKLESGNKKRVR
jgi:hypothetical protein